MPLKRKAAKKDPMSPLEVYQDIRVELTYDDLANLFTSKRKDISLDNLTHLSICEEDSGDSYSECDPIYVYKNGAYHITARIKRVETEEEFKKRIALLQKTLSDKEVAKRDRMIAKAKKAELRELALSKLTAEEQKLLRIK